MVFLEFRKYGIASGEHIGIKINIGRIFKEKSKSFRF